VGDIWWERGYKKGFITLPYATLVLMGLNGHISQGKWMLNILERMRVKYVRKIKAGYHDL